MQRLFEKTQRRNMTEVSFIILNHVKTKDQINILKNLVNFPVYQDQEGPSGTTWDLLSGKKDDFLLFDNCGRLNYHMRVPWSYLGYPYVRQNLFKMYNNPEGECGSCPTSRPNQLPTTVTTPFTVSTAKTDPKQVNNDSTPTKTSAFEKMKDGNTTTKSLKKKAVSTAKTDPKQVDNDSTPTKTSAFEKVKNGNTTTKSLKKKAVSTAKTDPKQVVSDSTPTKTSAFEKMKDGNTTTKSLKKKEVS